MNKQEAILWMMEHPEEKIYATGCDLRYYSNGTFMAEEPSTGEHFKSDPMTSMSETLDYQSVEKKCKWILRTSHGQLLVTINEFTEKEITSKVQSSPGNYSIIGPLTSERFFL